MKKVVFILTFILGFQFVNAQDEFEPQLFKTGYVAVEMDYVTGDFEDLYIRNGVGLSEAGLLLSYLPREKVILKTVFVYKPGQSLDMSLIEANVGFNFRPGFKLKLGRFLAPTSPYNLYFYAPMNKGITTPMMVSQREFYPQSIEGMDLHGEIQAIGLFSVGYNVLFGGYYDAKYIPDGTLRFHGAEPFMFTVDPAQLNDRQYVDRRNIRYEPLTGGKLTLKLGEYANLGVNAMMTRSNYANDYDPVSLDTYEPAMTLSQGLDFSLKIVGLSLNGEYWRGNTRATKNTALTEINTEGYFFQLYYELFKFTPFISYEYLKGITGTVIQRPKFGLTYRPSFSSMIKAEYLSYNSNTGHDFHEVLLSYVYSF